MTNRRLKKVNAVPDDGDFIIVGRSIFGGERKFVCHKNGDGIIAYDQHGIPRADIKSIDDLFSKVESYEIFATEPEPLTEFQRDQLTRNIESALAELHALNSQFDVSGIIDELKRIEL